jgi:hypothetical protein
MAEIIIDDFYADVIKLAEDAKDNDKRKKEKGADNGKNRSNK